MHWQFGEMEFGEMKRNTSNWSNFCMLLRRAGLTASAGLSCCFRQIAMVLCGTRYVAIISVLPRPSVRLSVRLSRASDFVETVKP